MKKHFDTLVEAINHLKAEGYRLEFLVEDGLLVCRDLKQKFNPTEFIANEIYRFEGDSDPADGSILFAIESKRHPLKGLITNGYGIYADTATTKVMKIISGLTHN